MRSSGSRVLPLSLVEGLTALLHPASLSSLLPTCHRLRVSSYPLMSVLPPSLPLRAAAQRFQHAVGSADAAVSMANCL